VFPSSARKASLILYWSFSRAGWFCRFGLRLDRRPEHMIDEHMIDGHMIDEHMIDEHMIDEHMIDEHMIDGHIT
jgi:hypothetical protein